MSHTKVVKDMIGRRVEVLSKPARIISLVPSQTELLYDLGLQEEVVGQTIFCVHPADMHQKKPRIGGTKKLNHEKIKALQPDLIIANKEENNRDDIERLEKEFPVWVSDVVDIPSAIEMILQVGFLVGRHKKAIQLSNVISEKFRTVEPLAKALKTCYLIWKNPLMAAGHDTFINSIMQLWNFNNTAINHAGRYPEISEQELQQAECILLSSEPYPFSQKHVEEIRQINPQALIKVVDGEMFSWYGSRLKYTVPYINSLVKEISAIKA